MLRNLIGGPTTGVPPDKVGFTAATGALDAAELDEILAQELDGTFEVGTIRRYSQICRVTFLLRLSIR
jgi:hypothetical protein